ncbi:hypothetical protein B9G53_18970 [Pseudanabaena sp. SR411]|uniref:QcrA and Rieske domain-containing protein n=1 Tax=Pseudanabaena sp. SR411 TaxID=1980935 RepID=UPI000B98A87D|nr:ubiquinol-cytochrome c reductase iron-sulfur subunit [Pseudanabaena sp. SR411]OYQ63062.1 hypothetical protein B9G53_18970 [Pseudanabaena sp. SR411]
MNRRKILTWVGLGWLVSVLPSTLTSCSTATKQAESSMTALANPLPATSPVATTSTIASSPVAATTVSKGSRVIGSIAQLERDGQLIADGVIIVRDRRNPQKLFAVNPICTHKGCDVNWQQDKQEFFCPCHDATFAADGSPREAPAKIPLATYAVTVENEQVLIVGDTSSSSNLQNNQASTNESPSKRDRLSSERKSDVQPDDDSPNLSPKKQERRSSESESEQEDEECRKEKRKQTRT